MYAAPFPSMQSYLFHYLTYLKIVLANGSIIDANAKENTDLFWALKGGGPNYGNDH
jgi:hypothetical protein